MQGTVVLLHGWGADSSRFNLLSKELKNLGFDIKAFDMPGFGEEPPPNKVWGIADYASWLKEKLKGDGIDFPIILVGHSFGGAVAIKFTNDNPKLVKKLILVSPAAVRFKRSKKRWVWASFVEIGKFIFSLPGISYFYEFARWFVYRVLRQKDYYKADGIMRKVMAKVLQEDLRPIFKNIKTPTLLVWGMDDVFTPFKLHKFYKEGFPNLTLKAYKGKGHNFFYLDVDDLINDIEEFLNND